jgi:hypothetical protein
MLFCNTKTDSKLMPRTLHRMLGADAPGAWRVRSCLLLCALGGMSCTTPMIAPGQESESESAAIQSQPAAMMPEAAPTSSPDQRPPATDSSCVSECTKRICGSDGCGGSCGTCALPASCDDDSGTCQECAGENCGCMPNCQRKVCGSDGCGGSCGTCDEDGEQCAEDGHCRRTTCGNDVLEGGEECDGGENCTDDCRRFNNAEITCFSGPSSADQIEGCKRCACLKCTQPTLDCYLSGEAVRDAACRIISECGVEQGCAGLDACICGTQQCRPPNGPCNAAADEALALMGGNFADIVPCLNDPDCAFHRAQVFGDCISDECGEICLESRP